MGGFPTHGKPDQPAKGNMPGTFAPAVSLAISGEAISARRPTQAPLRVSAALVLGVEGCRSARGYIPLRQGNQAHEIGEVVGQRMDKNRVERTRQFELIQEIHRGSRQFRSGRMGNVEPDIDLEIEIDP